MEQSGVHFEKLHILFQHFFNNQKMLHSFQVSALSIFCLVLHCMFTFLAYISSLIIMGFIVIFSYMPLIYFDTLHPIECK